jgi:hypothetical protein
METLQRVFAGHPFAHGLDERHLALLTGCAANVRFEAGQIFSVKVKRRINSIWFGKVNWR